MMCTWSIALAAIVAMGANAPAVPGDAAADKEYRLLIREMTQKPETHQGIADAATRAAQAFNRQATILAEDRDPVDIVTRRTRARRSTTGRAGCCR